MSQFYGPTDVVESVQDMSARDDGTGKITGLDVLMKPKVWTEEAVLCPALEWTLTLRYAMVEYQQATYRAALPASAKRTAPPECQYHKSTNTIHIMRLYPPYLSFPCTRVSGSHNAVEMVNTSMRMTEAGMVLPLSRVWDLLLTSKFTWVAPNAMAQSFGDDSVEARLMGSYAAPPLHAYTYHAIMEVGLSPRIDNTWRSVYDPMNTSVTKAGVYGWTHDNGLIDMRPFDTDMLALDTSTERDPQRRQNQPWYDGFIDVTYTPMSLEAGRIRSLVHGCRLRIPNRAVYSKLSRLLQIAQHHTHVVDNDGWVMACYGTYSPISVAGVTAISSEYLTMVGHDTPSVHVFMNTRIVSISATPGCIMKPVVSTARLYSGCEYPTCMWIDSLHLTDPSTHPSPLIASMAKELRTQCLRTFSLMVPFIEYNQPPRCILASNMSVQAIANPRTSGATTCRPLHHSMPIIRTPIVDKIVKHEARTGKHTLPGMPLLVVFANLPETFEDAVVIHQSLNDQQVFAHEGYVYHPIRRDMRIPEMNKPIDESHTWFRPCDDAIPIGYAHTTSGDRALLAELRSSGLRVGDKLATMHGQKFTISRIMSSDEMPWFTCTTTGERFQPHAIIARSSIDNRVTPAQIWESWLARSIVGSNDYDIFRPGRHVVVDSEYKPATITPWTCVTTLRGVFDGLEPTPVELAYGISWVWHTIHLVRDKQQYVSEIPRSSSILRGRLRGAGVRIGEMETHAMIALGLINCLAELTDSGDMVTVQICSECRRLTILCDCTLSNEGHPPYVEMNVRMQMVKADILMAVYRLNGDRQYIAELEATNPSHFRMLNSSSRENSMDDLTRQRSEATVHLRASSFKYY